MNKIRPPRPQDISSLRHARGYLDLAVNLVKFQSQYREVFNYIFGCGVSAWVSKTLSYCNRATITAINETVEEKITYTGPAKK